LADLKSLQDENTNLKTRRESFSDEDFIRTDVFKLFKSKNEELIKDMNHFETTNSKLREEVEKLQAERTTFKRQLEADAQALTQELDVEILNRDADLARVRSARDEMLAELTMRKQSQEQEKTAIEQMKELVSAKDDRISALESELDRLRPNEDHDMADPTPKLEQLTEEELLAKHRKLEKDFHAINQELPSIEKAYKKAMAMAHKKVMDFEALEARAAILNAEKGKADQKYFAARKDADTRNNEIRSLRIQNAKSAEIIAQLKEVETQNRILLANLEKQLADLRQANSAIAADCKKMESSSSEAARRTEAHRKEVGDLNNLIKSKDAIVAAIRERHAAQEVEFDRLRVKLDSLQKDRDSWKTRADSNSSDVEKGLRVSLPGANQLQEYANR
jgi:E3 ubiquitin-protein ligase BRE1